MQISITKKAINSLSQIEQNDFFVLLKKHYKDPTSLLDRELIKNNQVLIARVDDMLAGFFMTGWEEDVLIDGTNTTLIFLGLSCTDYLFKEANIGRILYSKFVLDSIEYEALKSQKTTQWFTTASPLVLAAVKKYWNVQAPDSVGNLTDANIKMLHFIKRKFSLDKYEDKQFPFILRAIAHNTQYTDAYTKFLFEIQNNIKTPLFENFNISEPDGDRFLFYSYNHSEDDAEKISAGFKNSLLRFSSFTIID